MQPTTTTQRSCRRFNTVVSHCLVLLLFNAPDCNGAALLQAFKQCPGCSEARVMWDHTTNRSKGYGFVAFRRAPPCAAPPRLPKPGPAAACRCMPARHIHYYVLLLLSAHLFSIGRCAAM